MPPDVYLFDTNAIIESVRVGAWNALTGGVSIQTVEEVRSECRKGDRFRTGYVVVNEDDLARMSAIHHVPPEGRAGIELMTKSDGLHDGEKDLFWYALNNRQSYRWVCSPDGGSVRFAVEHGLHDEMISLERACRDVGHSHDGLADHFTEGWLVRKRTAALLGVS